MFITLISATIVIPAALVFIAIGLDGILRKQPVIIRVQLLLWVSTLPSFLLIFPFSHFLESSTQYFLTPYFIVLLRADNMEMASWISDAIFLAQGIIFALIDFKIITAFMTWLNYKGYMLLGVSEASFRESLKAALERMSLASYDRGALVESSPSLEAHIQVHMNTVMGTAVVNTTEHKFDSRLKPLMQELSVYYKHSAIPINFRACIIYITIGAELGLLGVALTFL